MKSAIAFLLAISLGACTSEPPLPIAPGVYRFQQRFAEHPSMQGAKLKATIEGRRIELVNEGDSNVLPRGLVEKGMLRWHARTGQWIIVSGPDDADADEVGGCSDGPTVIDLVARIYWTC